ncbi:hypothetical protein BDK51DRAFT_36785 [Blyttiomyces helicus]|uniref:Galactose oxidase n=1 Tax=Blyttiomyces helicus TaxID=388810 RepID=A0A4P9W8F2_9FUNG|nr:hypothetical protein BDK51DRAFT_36785 [Blyttiomyces helicus]|eukprot:RKO87733.1 hypothetical protein BDK51DRAFT_36785 [Blyttiomyces helicus]
MDLNTYTWNATLSNSPIGRLNSNSLVIIGNDLYAFGGSVLAPLANGEGGTGPSTALDKQNQNFAPQNTLGRIPVDTLTTATVTAPSGPPFSRQGFCAANLGTGGMLVYGGDGGARFTTACVQDTFVFNARTSSWSKINNPTHPRACFLPACSSLAGKVYLLGGTDSAYHPDPELLWSFDPTSLSWAPVHISSREVSAPNPTDDTMTTIGNRYLVVSVSSLHDLERGNDSTLHFFDTTTSAWLPGPPSDLSHFAAPGSLTAPLSGPTQPASSYASTTPPTPSSAPATQPASGGTPPASASASPPSSTSFSSHTAAIAGGAAAGAILMLIGVFFIVKMRRGRKEVIIATSQSDVTAASSTSDEEAPFVQDHKDISALEPATGVTTALSMHPLSPPPPGASSSKYAEAFFGSTGGSSGLAASEIPFDRDAPPSLVELPYPSAPSTTFELPDPSAPEIISLREVSSSPFDRPAPSAPNIAFIGDAPSLPPERLGPPGSTQHVELRLPPTTSPTDTERDLDPTPAYEGAAASTPSADSSPRTWRALSPQIPEP